MSHIECQKIEFDESLGRLYRVFLDHPLLYLHWWVFLNEIRILTRKELTLEIRRDVIGHFVEVGLKSENSLKRFQVRQYVQYVT